MSDEKSVYPKIEIGCFFTPDVNIELVEKIINQSCTRRIALLKTKYYNPRN